MDYKIRLLIWWAQILSVSPLIRMSGGYGSAQLTSYSRLINPLDLGDGLLAWPSVGSAYAIPVCGNPNAEANVCNQNPSYPLLMWD